MAGRSQRSFRSSILGVPPSSAIRPYDDTTLRRRLIGKVFSDILLPCAPWPYHPVSAGNQSPANAARRACGGRQDAC